MNQDDYNALRARIERAYDPATFDKHGQTAVALMAEFLNGSQHSANAVLNWRAPTSNIEEAQALLSNGADVGELIQAIFAHGQTIHDPRYMGHQVPAPVPMSALFEAVSSLSNQGMTVYEMGPWSSAVERVMMQTLGEQLGLTPGFGGILTSGGSIANLTALLTARNIALQGAWANGISEGRDKAVIVAHGESHYSVERAAGILGMGTHNCLKAALDEHSKIDVAKLDEQLHSLRAQGKTVIAVVAAACSTRTGSYDPLRAIARVCKAHQVWLHVDAAHGAAAAFSDDYRHYLEGIEEADSVVWDAHKMLFMPALSTYLFYRKSANQYQALNQSASYLFDANAMLSEQYNTGLGTLECTKRAAAFSLWATWAVHGKQLFADLVNITYGMARSFARHMLQHPHFQLLNEPEANVLVFRYVPSALRGADAGVIGAFQVGLRKRLIESGEFYIVPAVDRGHQALRMVIMNPLTSEAEFAGLSAALQRHAEQMLAQN